jgi:hypothetical protein
MQFPLPQKWFRKESEFTSWFGREIQRDGGFWHKISDADMRTKPFDAICWYKQVMYWIELKVIPWMSCHPYKLLRGSSPSNPGWQVLWLSRFWEHWKSLMIVYSKSANKYQVLPFEGLTLETKITF